MDFARSTAIAPNGVDALFCSVIRGERGRTLRAQLASRHPERSAEEIEEALQAACKRFVDKAEGISAPGQVYAWIRTTAHRVLSREAGYEGHELPVDPTEGTLQSLVAEDPGPEEEAIANEDEADLATLVREVSSSLSERRRNVLALHGAGYKRPEIASRLGMPERTVKYDLHEIMDEARAALARLSGGGCERGEPLILRFACGLASAAESAQARLHLARCRRCELFSERLDAWREKAGALLPFPAAAEGASPGMLERLAHRTADGLASVKQQLLGGGAQLKQQASATYYRAVDPTPLAAVRPGTVAAVLAGCITIGGGAATYCVQQGVDPLGAATGLIAGTEETKPTDSPPPETTESTPLVPPAPPAGEEAAGETTPPAVEKQPPSEPPPPEQSFEPASPDYPASESQESAPVEGARPAPVSGGGAPQFGGP